MAGAAGARVARFPILLKSVQVKSKLYQISPRLPLHDPLMFSWMEKRGGPAVFSNEMRSLPVTRRQSSLYHCLFPRKLANLTLPRDNLTKILLCFSLIISLHCYDHNLLLRMQISFLLLHFSRKLEDRCIKHLLRERFLLKHDGF